MRTNTLSLCLFMLLLHSSLCGIEIILGSDQIEAPNGLNDALNTVNNNPNTEYLITIPYSSLIFPSPSPSFLNLPPIATNNNLTINGPLGGCTINGDSTYRGFFISSGNVTVNNLNLTQMLAQGGAGGTGMGGAGGGMGAGGTFFVKSGTTLTLEAVSMTFSTAQGGAGGEGMNNGAGGGGGGMGGAGGNVFVNLSLTGGGGGGLFGSGADGGLPTGGAGGGGLFGSGGVGGGTGFPNDSGGGGGGASDNGLAGTAGSGGDGGGMNGGQGGNIFVPDGEDGGVNTGGGGGYGNSPGGKGGKGGDNGGGGGGGASDAGGDNSGGDGGMYGGGGSAGIGFGTGGQGGFGGGGAGASFSTSDGAGVGGFGGGAGANSFGNGLDNTGFGGGGSGGSAGSGASGGLGGPFAGNGGSAGGDNGGGGGGAGLGGALFIHLNGTAVVLDGTAFIDNTAVGGTGGIATGCGIAGDPGQGLGRDIFMMASAQLTFNINDSLTIFSDIVGDNGLGGGSLSANGVTKLGTGTVTFNGNNTYTGSTLISQGSLVITGSTGPNNKTFIQNGGTLKGRGFIYDAVTVESGGTLSPGNPFGTLSIVGPLVFNSGANLNIQATAFGTSSIANVTGSILLDGNLTMDFTPGNYQMGQLFTILTATDGISGTFSSIDSNLFNFTLQPIYNANSLQILLQSPPMPSNCLQQFKGNVRIVGDYLNTLSGDSSLQSVEATLATLSCPELKKALKSISPGRNAFSTYASQETMFSVNKVATTRMSIQRSLRQTRRQNPEIATACQAALQGETNLIADATSYPYGSTTKAAAGEAGHAIWVTGLGELTHQNEQKQNPAFHTSAEGGLIGFETYQFSDLLLGLTAGYAHSNIDIDEKAGSSQVDYYFVGFYETAYLSNGYIEFSLWGTYDYFKNKRHIQYPGFDATARSHHIGWQLTPYLGAGYDIGFNWGVIEPFAGLEAVISVENPFSEKGASPLNMEQPSHTSEFLRFETGANFYEAWNKKWGSLILRETVSYVLKKPYHVGTVNAAIVGAPESFTVYGFTNMQHILSPGAELFYKHKTGAFASMTYSGEFSFGTGFLSNELIAKLGVYF